MREEEKERLNKICKCGHRRGEHTYHKGSFCTRVMTCDCKVFEEVTLSDKEVNNG